MTDSETADRIGDRIAEVGAHLNVPEATVQTGQSLYEGVEGERDLTGYQIEPVAAAALTVAARTDGLPITVGDVARSWNEVENETPGELRENAVVRRIELVSDATGATSLPAQPEKLLERYAGELDVSEETYETAGHILEALLKRAPEVLTRGTSPSGNAAAALYLANRVVDSGDDLTQAEVGDVADVSEMTIRKRYKGMAEALEDRSDEPDRTESEPETSEAKGATASHDETESSDDRETRTSEDGESEGRDDEDRDDDRSPEGHETYSYDIDRRTYFAFLSTVVNRNVDQSEVVARAVRESLKSLLEGEELRPPDVGETISVETDLPDRIVTVMDSVVSDPGHPFDSPDELVSVAVSSVIEDSGVDDTIESVDLPESAYVSARRLVSRRDDLDSVHELLHDAAYELEVAE